MSIIYPSKRVGKGGKVFTLYKFRTLREDIISIFPLYKEERYTFYGLGKFLRKTKLDELPNLISVLQGHQNFFGPRAEEERTIDILPQHIKDKLLSVKPGLLDIASLHFFDEGQILEKSEDVHRDYWERIRPLKWTLQVFYIDNRCFLLNLALSWIAIKKIIRSIFK